MQSQTIQQSRVNHAYITKRVAWQGSHAEQPKGFANARFVIKRDSDGAVVRRAS